MSDESKEKRHHEEHHAHHPHPHKHPHKSDESEGIHPAWYIVVGAVLIFVIVLSWTFFI